MINIKKKFLSKIYSGYGYKFYPEQFKINFKNEKNFFYYKKPKKQKKSGSYNLSLASESVMVNSSNIWNFKKFNDREDFSLLHRWTWAIKLVSSDKRKTNYKKIQFIENALINWCILYSTKKIERKNIIFEPYNISERICNYLILIKLKIIKPNQYILQSLEKQFFFLLENIEYYKFKLSNHSLNNLRAIYLFSTYSKKKKLTNYSLKFICYLLNNFLDNHGFFKFGSSNYQFIFARWVSDILLFSSKIKSRRVEFIKNKFNKIIYSLNFFKQQNKKEINIPFFGDISPDIENRWLLNFFFNKKDNHFFQTYWRQLSCKNLVKKINSKEWIKIQNRNFSIYSRNPKLVGFDFNHSHNDFFNFILFLRGKAIFIDLGRKNYSSKSLRNDISSKSHNSICIDDKGIYDEYLLLSLLNKFGLKDLINCNYSTQSNYQNLIRMNAKNKKFEITRKIRMYKNKVEINDQINLKKYLNLTQRFNLNTNLKKTNLNEIMEIHIEKNQYQISFKSNEKFSKVLKTAECYSDYGRHNKCTSLFLNFKKNKKLNILTKIKI